MRQSLWVSRFHLSFTAIIFLCPLLISGGLCQEDDRTFVYSIQEFFFPERVPISPVSWVLYSESYPILVRRVISVEWGNDNVNTVGFILPGTMSDIKKTEGSFEAHFSLRTYSPTILMQRSNRSSIEMVFPLDSSYYAATFGRVQLRVKHNKPRYLKEPYRSKTVLHLPKGASINTAQPMVEMTEEGQIVLQDQNNAFIYFEQPQAKKAAFQTLAVFSSLIVISIALLVLRRNYIGTIWQRVLTKIRSKSKGVLKASSLLFLSILAIILAISVLAGPSPKLNVVLFHNPNYAFSLQNLEDNPEIKIFLRPTTKQLALMNSFGMIDAIVVEAWELTKGHEHQLNRAVDGGTRIFLHKDYAELNRPLFDDVDVVEYSSPSEAESALLTLAERKSKSSLMGAEIHGALSVTVSLLSFTLVGCAAFLATLLSVHLSKGRAILDTVIAAGVFLVLFLFVILCFFTIGNVMGSPLASHGPSGAGITLVSLLGTRFGGGNWPRAMAAILGILAGAIVLASEKKLRFSILALFFSCMILLVIFQANPLVSPLFVRVVSGENPYTPPREYPSRQFISNLTSLTYRVHFSQSIYYALASEDGSSETTLSRGIASGFAVLGILAVLGRLSTFTSSMLSGVMFLVLGRFFARIGDMDPAKTLWSMPTGLILGGILAILLLSGDRGIGSSFGYMRRLFSRSRIYHAVAVFALAGTGITLLYQSIVDYGLYIPGEYHSLGYLIAGSILCIAALGVAEFVQEPEGERG